MNPLWEQLLRCPRHLDDRLALNAISTDRWELRCPSCETVYPIVDGIVDMLPAQDAEGPLTCEREMRQWDAQAMVYETLRSQDLIYMAGIHAAVRALRPATGEIILDAACGTGMTTLRWYRPGIQTVCLDLSWRSLQCLRGRLAHDAVVYVRGDLARLPLAGGVFDRVLCANALQHLPTPQLREQSVRQLSRVVRPGGKVVITAHNFSIPKRRAGWIKEGSARAYQEDIQYIYRFDSGEFRDLLGRALDVQKVCGAGLPLPYRLKLSPISRLLERALSRLAPSARWGHMLVGICSASLEPTRRAVASSAAS